MAKVFNGRAATEEYMSTHSLTFSTPEMTLRKFALWLGEQVSIPGGEKGPRMVLYLEEKGSKKESDIAPEVDDSFRPSGAVTDMYKGVESPPTSQMTPPSMTPLEVEGVPLTTISTSSSSPQQQEQHQEPKFCISCGSKIKPSAKFCTKCGSAQA
ncbi:MAG TPA: zinc ribbon domain-containing protein [Nitrososphaera sp.]|nr:zinc ribbon domain-containing protein [Nitrososphaera sp.]